MDIADIFHRNHIKKRDYVILKAQSSTNCWTTHTVPYIDVLAVEWHNGGYIQQDKVKGVALSKQTELSV
jgi:hypothetical protein